MPGIVKCNMDAAGGTVRPLQTIAKIEGEPIGVVGCPVDYHGTSPHNSATMAEGSTVAKINGVPVCRAGDAASCGCLATGQAWALISD